MANSSGKFAPVQAIATVVHSNLDQEVIQITEDRLRLVLNEHVASIEDSKSWHTPLGLLIAIVLAFVTADFRDAFLISAAVWQASFLISGVLSAFWLIRCWLNSGDTSTIDDVVMRVKSKTR